MRTRVLAAGAAAFAAALAVPAAAQAADVIYGVTADDRLVSFSSDSPGNVAAPLPISGLEAGEGVLAIDVRPATGGLYALTSASRVYVVDPVTGAASEQFTLGEALDEGADYGMDFNPTVDKLRLVSSQGDNRRINPDTGAELGPDADVGVAGVTAAAYTNNVNGRQAGATTQLFTINSTLDTLNLQDPPNDGSQQIRGALGVDVEGDASFDIPAAQNLGYAALTPAGAPQGLYTVDLTSGAATLVGTIGGTAPLVGLAAAKQDVPLYGLTAPETVGTVTAQRLLTLASSAPRDTEQPRAVPVIATRVVSGLPSGVELEGIDTRPANGLVYGLGSDGFVYLVDVTSGRVTQTPSEGLDPLGATAFGIDFNPIPDLLRVVTNGGDNYRVDPDGDQATIVDGPTGLRLVGAAYRSSFPGTASTRLYTIDANANTVNVQDPPNDGDQANQTALGVDGAPFDVDDEVGYDLAAQDDLGYLAAQPNGATRSSLYRLESGIIPVTSGPLTGATPIGQIGADSAAGFTVRGLTAAQAGLLGFVAGEATASEASGGAQIAVGRTVSYGYATVQYTIDRGGDDPLTGAVTFAPGERLKSIPVPIQDDADAGSQAFAVTLTRGAGGYRFGLTESTLTVIDDDQPEPPTTTVTTTTPAPPPVTVTTPGQTVTTPGQTVTTPGQTVTTPGTTTPGATVTTPVTPAQMLPAPPPQVVTIPGTTVVVPAPPPGLQPDRGRPVALVFAPDRRLRTLRRSGVPAIVATNEASRIDLEIRRGDLLLGSATRAVTGPTVVRVQLRLNDEGRRTLRANRTRSLQMVARVTDVAGNVSRVSARFRAVRSR